MRALSIALLSLSVSSSAFAGEHIKAVKDLTVDANAQVVPVSSSASCYLVVSPKAYERKISMGADFEVVTPLTSQRVGDEEPSVIVNRLLHTVEAWGYHLSKVQEDLLNRASSSKEELYKALEQLGMKVNPDALDSTISIKSSVSGANYSVECGNLSVPTTEGFLDQLRKGGLLQPSNEL